MSDFLQDFKRLTSSFYDLMQEDAVPVTGNTPGSAGQADSPSTPNAAYLGGQADLTPLRNKAREALDALSDAQKAADQGRLDDCLESFRRAKSCIDMALGGQMGPFSGSGMPSPVRP